MGTETKFNCYSENSSTAGGNIPKVVKSSSGLAQNNCINALHNGRNLFVNGSDSQFEAVPKAAATPVPFVPIHIDENNVVEGAKEILKVIRPHWDLNAVQFKRFTDGITNKLVGCFNTQTNDDDLGINSNSNHRDTSSATTTNNSSSHLNDIHDDNNDSGNLSDTETDADTIKAAEEGTRSTDATDSVVLIRVYGNKTDLLIDRQAETRNILLLHSYDFAPSLYATFKNGLAYDYVPGVTLNATNVLQPEVWQLVARRMAEMHRVVNAEAAAEPHVVPMLWSKTQSFFDLVPERFSDADKQKRLEGTFLPISRLRDEFVALYSRLEKLGSPVVFAHNDLLLGNVVYTESQRTVSFIDYEYADYNFQAFDIGNHFAEFAGVDEVDYSRYPPREFQFEWLRVYLQSYLRRTLISDAEVERLYVQVNQFALAAHFFWTVWSLIQAEHSTIDFDYVDYAFVRYNEYLARKEEFSALTFETSGATS